MVKISLKELNEEYKKLIQNPLFQQWRKTHKENVGFYNGNLFLDYETMQKLQKQGVKPLSCNLIAPTVNVLLGIEIQNEYRIKVNVTNMTDDARDFEDAINQYFCVLQNKEEFAGNLRRALKDSVIGGIGFVRVCYKDHQPQVEYINPLNIVWDFTDKTPDFTGQYTIVTWENLHKSEIRLRYGLKNYAKLRFEDDYSIAKYDDDELEHDLSQYKYPNRVYTFRKKEVMKGWQGYTEEGELVQTIKEDIAKVLQETEETQLAVNTNTVICQGIILDRNIEEPVVVGGEIPIIPMIYQRDDKFIPKGLVSTIRDLQMGFNLSFSRITAYANTEKTHAYISNVNDRELLVNNPELLIRPNAVVILTPQDKIETIRPNEAVQQQARLIETYMEFIKKASGIEDESKGIQTNAQSGIAQQQRDINSLRCNAFLYDNFKRFKKRIGGLILQQLQNSFDTDIVVRMLDDEEKNVLVLNQVIEDADGNIQIINDLSTKKWNISIEQSPADSTTRAQKRLDLLSIAQTPLAPYIMKSKEWLGLFVSNPGKVMKEIQETTMQEQGLQPQK